MPAFLLCGPLPVVFEPVFESFSSQRLRIKCVPHVCVERSKFTENSVSSTVGIIRGWSSQSSYLFRLWLMKVSCLGVNIKSTKKSPETQKSYNISGSQLAASSEILGRFWVSVLLSMISWPSIPNVAVSWRRPQVFPVVPVVYPRVAIPPSFVSHILLMFFQ